MNSSQDMFEDTEDEDGPHGEPDMNISRDMFAENEELSYVQEWVGVSLKEVKSRVSGDPLPVISSASHQVLGKPSTITRRVRMPHSPSSLFPISDTEVKPRWELVKEALGKRIQNSKDLENAIFSYNIRGNQKPLNALHQFFANTLMPEESDHFFKKILPEIIKLALEMEGLPDIRLLGEHESASLSLSQEQAGILLANAFLSTFPRQQSKCPHINFIRLFQCGSVPNVQEKIKCFINYFRRICSKRPDGMLTYSRRYLEPSALPSWPDLDIPFTPIHISSEGTIEEQGLGLLEIDFANKMVGGGVLGRGCVQEEIKFLICPELVVARLFTECLDDTEALIVKGCEQFNKYDGYGPTFTWDGNFVDTTKRDEWNRRKRTVAAIDATFFSDFSHQYKEDAIRRELNKAYVGFSAAGGGSVATGNWGCGVFRGDPELKSLVQLMAAALANVSIAYFSFGDARIRNRLHKMWSFLMENDVSVDIFPEYDSQDVLKQESEENEIKKVLKPQSCGDYGDISSNDDDQKPDEVGSTDCEKPKKDCGKEVEDSGKRGIEKPCLEKEISDCEDTETNRGCVQKEERSKKTSMRRECSDNEAKEGDGRGEPVPGKTCSLTTHEGRAECLSAEKARWDAYKAAISTCSSSRPPLKRKISDYFQKVDNN